MEEQLQGKRIGVKKEWIKSLDTSVSKITTFGWPKNIEPRLSEGHGVINPVRPPVAGIKWKVVFPNINRMGRQESVVLGHCLGQKRSLSFRLKVMIPGGAGVHRGIEGIIALGHPALNRLLFTNQEVLNARPRRKSINPGWRFGIRGMDVIERLEQGKRRVNVTPLAVDKESHNYHHCIRVKLSRGQFMELKKISNQVRKWES
jgi:hypothetical protein